MRVENCTKLPWWLFQALHAFCLQQGVLHAVQGNPPKTATGRVGAVGHIHLICVIEYPNKHNFFFFLLRSGKIPPFCLFERTVGNFIKYKMCTTLESTIRWDWKTLLLPYRTLGDTGIKVACLIESYSVIIPWAYIW